MVNVCGDCKWYNPKFERRLTMEKQPTENITIPVWRYDLLVKAETMLELAKQIHRNSEEYEAKRNLMIVFDADKEPEEPCETI